MSQNTISLHFDNLPLVVNHIISNNHKLIYFAGASASGKSFIAEELVKKLEQENKKVLLISSDSYYSNESQIKYLLYGTFDHPKLINYDILEKDLQNYFSKGMFNLPVYSFIEKRTTNYITIDQSYDIVIVEWLYTVNSLPKQIQTKEWTITAYNIVVHAPIEEIIFRRLVRDQKRVKEPLHTLIDVMSNVFPMRKIFWSTQESLADCIISNDYTILNKEGRKSQWKQITKDNLPQWKPYDIHYTKDYIYDDSDDSDGRIIISEVYRENNELLDHVILQKRSSDPRKEQGSYESISMTLYKPGISTELHTLLQLAWLAYQWSYSKTIYYYNKPKEKAFIIKEKAWKYYQLVI